MAQSGARSPSVLPAESMAKPIGLRKSALTPRRRLRNPAFLRPLITPSGSPQRNAQARSELTKPDNCTAFENVLTAIPTHGGTGTQHSASCFSFPDEGKETGVIERKTFRQERMTARTDHTTPQQEHRTGIAAHKPPPDPPRPADQPPARTIPSAGAATGQTQPFAGAQFTIL